MFKRNNTKTDEDSREIDELLKILRNHKEHIEKLEEKVKKIEKTIPFSSSSKNR